MEDIEIGKINKGFDRDIDYTTIKNKFIDATKRYIDEYYKYHSFMTLKRIAYLIIACIQLRNGSRISEAVKAFVLFCKVGKDKRAMVKISKSDTSRIGKDGKKRKAKARFRELMYPDTWIVDKIFDDIKNNKSLMTFINNKQTKKRVLDYLSNNFECNTHSLRYAFINYMIYEKKRPLNDVAKFVGHVNTNQLTTYTQIKNTNKIFDIDM